MKRRWEEGGREGTGEKWGEKGRQERRAGDVVQCKAQELISITRGEEGKFTSPTNVLNNNKKSSATKRNEYNLKPYI